MVLGAAALIAAYQEFPTIAFAVALTYSSYTSAQKTAHVSGILAMFYQTLFLAPFFLAAILFVECSGQGAFSVASPFQLLLLSFAGVIWAVVSQLTGHTVAGWASMVAILCFMGGIQLICLGVIGIYVGKIYMESKHRPRYIISERTDNWND